MVDTNVPQTLPRIVCREESKCLRPQFISRRQHWLSLGRYRKVQGLLDLPAVRDAYRANVMWCHIGERNARLPKIGYWDGCNGMVGERPSAPLLTQPNKCQY
jgi:hypothetical protein